MNSSEIRNNFLLFFKKKGHKVISSSSLVPDDSTVLFTSAGMQQFSLYLTGKKNPLKDFGTRHLISCQKCFRSDDIGEVGDDTHHTFFEMLGNWSIGQDKNGYFKKEAIEFAFEFLVSYLQIPISKLWVTVFKGNKVISEDFESQKIWQKLGISKTRIRKFDEKDNLWGPVGKVGPCGPNSEIYYDRGKKFGCKSVDCGPNCPLCQRFVEIWNLVFMEYFLDEDGNYQRLPRKNVDTGIGFERLTAIMQKKPSSYETDLFWPIIQEVEKISFKKYNQEKRIFRILTDHLKSAIFLAAEGILPDNLSRGYILRRILRRIIRYAKFLNLENDWYVNPMEKIVEIYESIYPEVKKGGRKIINIFQDEEKKFGKTLEKGLLELNKLIIIALEKSATRDGISGKDAFNIYQTFGFPLELIQEELAKKKLTVNEKDFQKELEKHQKVSRAGVEKKFGGHGIKKSAKEDQKLKTKLHTATHLLHSALREVLDLNIKQMGSDITEERLRFDFSYDRKMTADEILSVENLVNQKIKENLRVKKEEMFLKQAVNAGALAFFREKYPKRVLVYTIFNPKTGKVFSKEICAGPHVESIGGLGKFKIKKEKSSSAGVRRIKAVLIKNL